MSYDYSENILVQESTGHLLADELGWQVELAYNQEILGKNGTFGRSSYKDILLVRYFQKALRTLNPWITDAQVIEAQNTFEKHLSSASLMQINEEKYAYIRDGIPVTEKKPNGQTEEKRAMIIDFQHPDDMERNHFLAVKEMKIHGDLYRRRTDIVGFVNGIPLLFVELKKNSVDVQNAYTDNYTDYLDTIPQLFYYNAFLMLSNGVEAKVGTLGSKYEFFHEWKRLSEQEQGSVALETMLCGICKKENFLDLLENFILYDHSGGKTVKILARNHQYLGVNEAVKAYEVRKLNNGKLGVFWHTQGSGKSYSMVFLSQKIRRKFAGSPTIVVLTDREELNSQISDTFENCGLLGKTKASKFIATSGEDLISKLKGNPSFIFTLIQKFNKKVDEPIIPDHDIIIMYNFVQKYWQDDIKALEKQIQTASQQKVQELERKLNWMKETEMAVVISQEQNEIQTFKKWNLDIKYHREKMEKRELDKEFKDKDNPLRVVFVCAMWLTGFDVKCLSCLYLDKPLKAHTLMQTIARANRVAEGKSNGLIIDYIGIVKALRKALADYTANVGGGSTDPTIDKGELIERVLETIAAADEFLDSKDFDLDDLVYAKDFAKISLLLTAANAVSDSRESKKQFITYGNELNRMMKYLERDDISKADRERKDAIIAIVDELKKKKKHVDNTDLMVQINGILGDYIMIERAADDRGFAKRFDISKIDFDLLRREFAKVKKKNLAFMDLDELIQVRLDAMIRENPRRVDYYIRYQQIIEEYNSEQDRVNIEKTFMELMDLANSMNEEEQRYVREGFSSDEELSMYDMLFDENLSKEDIKKIKKVAVDLLDKIKTKIAELDHWTDKQETKAEVDTLIGKILWEELPESYSDSAIFEYRKLIFEYVFMRYKQVA